MVFPLILIELGLVIAAILTGSWAFGSITDSIIKLWPIIVIAVVAMIATGYMNYKREKEKGIWEYMKYKMLLKKATEK